MDFTIKRATAIQIEDWEPDDETWCKLLSFVQLEERERISRFLRPIDRKRALLGRLLLRKLVCEDGGIEWSALQLSRTATNKPIVSNPCDLKVPTLQFNMSHHGNWVLAASHQLHQVGIDVMKYETPRGSRSMSDFIENMSSSFARHELETLHGCQDEGSKLHLFYFYWCLKEAFIKATGDGLSFGLSRLDFHGLVPGMKANLQRPSLVLDGEVCDAWQFELGELDEHHCFAIATQSHTAQDFQLDCVSASDFVASLMDSPLSLMLLTRDTT